MAEGCGRCLWWWCWAGFVVENSHDKDVLIRVWRDEKKKKPTVNVLGAAAPGPWMQDGCARQG